MSGVKKYYNLSQQDDVAELSIFGDITSWPWMDSDVSAHQLSKKLGEIEASHINVYINSYGGEVAEGLAIHNSLKRHPAKVTTYCEGFACSIASVIFMAGDERVMEDASLLMIHNPWTRVAGNANELRKEAGDLDTIAEASMNAYTKWANIEATEIKKMMDEETWISPQKALEIGFATAIEGKMESDVVSQSAAKTIMEKMMALKKDVAELVEKTLIDFGEKLKSIEEKMEKEEEIKKEKEENRLKSMFGKKAGKEEK